MIDIAKVLYKPLNLLSMLNNRRNNSTIQRNVEGKSKFYDCC